MKNEAASFLVTLTTLNFFEQKKVFYYLECSTPTGLKWYTVTPSFSAHHNRRRSLLHNRFSIVTQRSSPLKRCETTLKTAV